MYVNDLAAFPIPLTQQATLHHATAPGHADYNIGPASGTQAIDPHGTLPQVMAPANVPSSFSLDIQRVDAWLNQVMSYIESSRSQSATFAGLLDDAFKAGGFQVEVTRDPAARSSTWRQPDGIHRLLVASADTPTPAAMQITVTKLLAQIASPPHRMDMFRHYLAGGTHLEHSHILDDWETTLVSGYGCNPREARYVAAEMHAMYGPLQRTVQVLRELHALRAPASMDDAVVAFMQAAEDHGRRDSSIKHLINAFRERTLAIPFFEAPSIEPCGPARVDDLIRKAGREPAYQQLSEEAGPYWGGFEIVEHPEGKACEVRQPDGRTKVTVPSSLSESGVCIALVDSMAKSVFRPHFDRVQQQLEGGFYQAASAAGPHSDQAWVFMEVNGFSVAEAEYVASSLSLEHLRHERAVVVLTALRDGGVIRADQEFERFVGMLKSPIGRAQVVEHYRSKWRAADVQFAGRAA